jgi:hypothetical protein
MKYFTLIVLLLFAFHLKAQNEDFQTHCEKTAFKETSRYDACIKFCKDLADASEWVHYTHFGKSLQGRDLPLLVIDKDGLQEARELKQTEKAIVLIQAGIHAGEINGKDAGLMLIRDIVIHHKYQHLLNNVCILFIPIFNVDGHEYFSAYGRINQNGPEEMGFRTNANNLNLNRDYLKADAKETQAWLSLFLEWLPDFFIDIHSTDGADYQYALTYGMEIYGNMSEKLTNWQKDVFIPYVEKKMEKDDYPIFPYVAFRNWHDPRSGLKSYMGNPMLAQSYTAVQNRPGLLIESHMLKDYKTRVLSTYQMLIHSLSILNKQSYKLKEMIRECDHYLASDKFREKEFVLRYKLSSDSTMVSFKGVDYSVEKSDLSGGNWFKYSKTPKTFSIPFFDKHLPEKSVKVPAAYIIPPEWTDVIKRLEWHGIEIYPVANDVKLNVESYRFIEPRLSSHSFEGRQVLEHIELIKETGERLFPKYSYVVGLNQPSAKVILHLLEPEARGSLAYWGFFNSVFEQKEYGETYVMEVLAREMLKNDPDIRAEFEEKLKDEAFAQNSWAILNWFYSKTLYWDQRINQYPIGRIIDKSELNKIQYAE